MMKIILYVLLIWVVFQFVTKLVIPVYRTTRQIKKGFREMQEKMNAQQGNDFNQPQREPDKKTTSTKEGDYIEFEEIK